MAADPQTTERISALMEEIKTLTKSDVAAFVLLRNGHPLVVAVTADDLNSALPQLTEACDALRDFQFDMLLSREQQAAAVKAGDKQW